MSRLGACALAALTDKLYLVQTSTGKIQPISFEAFIAGEELGLFDHGWIPKLSRHEAEITARKYIRH